MAVKDRLRELGIDPDELRRAMHEPTYPAWDNPAPRRWYRADRGSRWFQARTANGEHMAEAYLTASTAAVAVYARVEEVTDPKYPLDGYTAISTGAAPELLGADDTAVWQALADLGAAQR